MFAVLKWIIQQICVKRFNSFNIFHGALCWALEIKGYGVVSDPEDSVLMRHCGVEQRAFAFRHPALLLTSV